MSKTIDLKILAEITVVLAVMLGVKDLADSAAVPGAGSIAMWCGILVATAFMTRRGASWRGLGLVLPRGGREWMVTLGLALLAVVSVILFMVFVLDLVASYFGWATPPDAPDRFAFLLGKPYVFLMYLIVVVWFGAALGEELLMRGFVLNRLADLFGHGTLGWAVAMVVHAITFGSALASPQDR